MSLYLYLNFENEESDVESMESIPFLPDIIYNTFNCILDDCIWRYINI